MARRQRFTMSFEVERGNSTVEYEVEYEVSPGEPERGPTYDCGGTPAYPPEVESKAVFYVHRDRSGKLFREERPELEDMVDDDELLEHAGGQNDYDGPDTTAEARGER